MSNENTEYEQLVQKIYQLISNMEGIDNIEIQHNVKIEGRSGCKHQLDVYWKFEHMGIVHQVAVECKNYTASVSIGKIRDFYGVLDDIGNIKGIFVTKVGYQSGAKAFADSKGIELMELRFPKDSDWEGRVKDIIVTICVLTTNIKKRHFILDMEWVVDNTNLKLGDGVSISGMEDRIEFFDQNGKLITNLHQIENSLPRNKAMNDISYSYHFDNNFVNTDQGIMVRIKKIEYIYDVNEKCQEMVIEGNNIAQAIFIKGTGDGYFLNKENTIKKISGKTV